MDPEDSENPEVVLSAAEYEAIAAALAEIAGPGGRGPTPSLNSLLAQWASLVDEVAEGYAWCAAEFGNDIWCRTALARLWPRLPARLRAARQRELEGADDRYRSATVGWPGRPEEGALWWTRRVPRLLEVESSEQRDPHWPLGWETLPFPRPASVQVVTWG
ncbi:MULTISPECIES: hypothetical protein [Streptomyces]|uniref:hypothetical protein n=1 Tax=Streptomyces TaxID=1883 RepID=UPI00069EB016|nr:hypothetical protein [Streptomyces virginiae]